MATKIVTKNSSTASAVPTASDLVQGELAVNVADKRLFTEDNGGAIVELGTKPSTIDINAGTIDGTAIGASSASTGAFTTLTATGLTVDGGGGSGPINFNSTGGARASLDYNNSTGLVTLDNLYGSIIAKTGTGGSSAERMRIDSSGNVGIGTSSPAFKLDVAGNARANYFALRGNESAPSESAFVYRPATGVLGFGTGTAERMRINSAGQVGIACTNPDDGNLQIGDANSAFNIAIAGPRVKFGYDGSNAIVQGGLGKGVAFCVNNSALGSGEAMRIDSSGNLLVGQTAQNYNVVGASIGSDGLIRSATTGQATAFNRKGSHGIISAFYKDGVTVGSISTNANSLPSDRNFKRNIQDLTLGLDFVESLNPVTYNFKIDDEGQAVMTGLIAQEVEEALTAAGVEKNSMTLLQHKPTEDVNESDYQMDYLKFVPILINSIKEQQTLIELLTARMAALEE